MNRNILEEKKSLSWWDRNWYFVGTGFIIVLCILLYGIGGRDWPQFLIAKPPHTIGGGYGKTPLYLDRFFRSFFNSIAHNNWQHTLLNMLCFLVAGLYLERKTGSLFLVGLVVVFGFLSGNATSAHGGRDPLTNIDWVGFSVINFALYAYIIIEYIFSFQKHRKNRFNTIFGGIVCGLIYFACCFTGGYAGVGFTWYPYDLLYNFGHYTGFAVGIVIGLLVQLVQLKTRKETLGKTS